MKPALLLIHPQVIAYFSYGRLVLLGTKQGLYYEYMNYINYGPGFGDHMFGFGFPAIGGLILLVVLWSLLWKGLALWRSAKRGDMWWFIAFLVLNTLGILEIIYLFAVTGAKISDFTKSTTRDPHAGHSHN